METHLRHKLAVDQMRSFGGALGIEFSGGFEMANAWRGTLSAEQLVESVPPGLVRQAAGMEAAADTAIR
ncbi:hypothetical protein ACIQPR_46345 [Streptomyces sp. NPDC091280]|uniref:hypothetical protein n=1 Tax=Streptomyces sp. NPDC091280 TaxID=3365984 RepID=UPI003829240C